MKVKVTYSDKNGEEKYKIGECSQSDYDDAQYDKMHGRGIAAYKVFILDLILAPASLKRIEVIG
jgi:hypothetical protein